MPSFTQLLTLAVCAVSALAVSAPHGCLNPKLVHNTPIEVDGITITSTGFSCASKEVAGRSFVKRTDNVCGEICTNSCNNDAGNLPPIVDDCNKIKSAISIFSGKTSDSFTVGPFGVEQLTFGTCTFTFQSYSYDSLTYCFSDLGIEASQAGSACFPPEQPFTSEGSCTAGDGSWSASAGHSASS